MNSPSLHFNEQLATPLAFGEPSPSRGRVPPVVVEFLRIVNRWKVAMACIVITAVLIGLVITLLTPPVYTASSQMEISRAQKKITNVEGVEAENQGMDMEFYDTQYALLKARTLAERVARQLNLAQNDVFFVAHGFDVGKIKHNGSDADRRVKRETEVVNLLLKNITISPVRRSRLVNISYTSRAPALSAKIVNAWTDQFIQTSMDRQFASTADARKFLEERLASLKGKLETSERDAVTYASRSDIVTLQKTQSADGSTRSSQTLAASDLGALNQSLSQAIADRIAAQSRAGQAGKAEGASEAINNPGLAQLRQRRAEAAAEYAKLLVQYEPEYPLAKARAMEMQSLDAAIAREVGRISSSRTIAYSEALSREQQLRAQVSALKSRLDTEQRASIQYNIYEREADTNRQLYDALLQRYKEIGVAGAVGINNIAVIDPATVPERASGPNLAKNLVLATLAGLALAALAALLLEQLDDGVSDIDQITDEFQLPVLGNTPLIDGEVEDQLSDAKSVLAEAYYSIRSNMGFVTSHGFPRSFAVTSTQPNEGKSLTSLAIAAIVGRAGKNVIIVDADMRSPSMHGMTDRTNTSGLSNYLAGNNYWPNLVQRTNFPGVTLMTTGPIPPSAAELLDGDRLSKLVAELLLEYDHVIVDAPPVMGLADTPLISRAVEGCLFIIQSGGAPVRAVQAAIDRLHMVKAHIFGAILTKAKYNGKKYGYGYGYGHAHSLEDRRAA
jgi:polysaccharide biosynthesis transport protein